MTSEKLKTYSWKTDFTMQSMITIPIGVAVNFVAGNITRALGLPIYLDMMGTYFNAFLGGPWVGAITAVITQLVGCITRPSGLPFVFVSLAASIVAGFFARHDMYNKPWKILVCILVQSVVAISISTPTAVIAFGGITDSGSGALSAIVLASGVGFWETMFGVGFITQTIDTAISVTVALLIVRVLPARTLIQYSLGEKYIKNKESK